MDLLTTLLEACANPDHPGGEEGIAQLRALLVDADTDALEAARTAALQRFDDLYDANGTPSQDDLSTMEALSDVLDAVGLEAATREQAAEAARQRAAELAARAHPDGEPDEGADGEGDPSGDEGEPADPAQPAQPAQPEPALVAGAAPPARSGGVPARRSPTPLGNLPRSQAPATPRPRIDVIAAADVPGFSSGQALPNMGTLATAIENRFAAMPKNVPGMRHEVGIASFRRTIPDEIRFETFGGKGDQDTVDRCCDERRLQGGSLLAAAGWCAPPEIDFTLCPALSTLTGMVDLPTFTPRRGGVSLPTFPDYQTIAEALHGQIMCGPNFTGKLCIEAPCVTFTDFAPCAVPLCVQNDILQERGYPEVIERFASEVMTAQAHMMNAYIIQQMVAGVDDTITAANVVARQGALHQVVDELQLLIEWYRDLYQMADDATLEVLAPSWLPGFLTQDGRKRPNGTTDWTRATVAQSLRDVGAQPQFVRDWQPLAAGTPNTPPAPPTFNPPTEWPTSVDLLLYPAGTFGLGRGDIINLNAIYDSVLLKDNKYTALFVEEQVMLVKRCTRALKVSIPLCVSGAMGPNVDLCAGP